MHIDFTSECLADHPARSLVSWVPTQFRRRHVFRQVSNEFGDQLLEQFWAQWWRRWSRWWWEDGDGGGEESKQVFVDSKTVTGTPASQTLSPIVGRMHCSDGDLAGCKSWPTGGKSQNEQLRRVFLLSSNTFASLQIIVCEAIVGDLPLGEKLAEIFVFLAWI